MHAIVHLNTSYTMHFHRQNIAYKEFIIVTEMVEREARSVRVIGLWDSEFSEAESAVVKAPQKY